MNVFNNNVIFNFNSIQFNLYCPKSQITNLPQRAVRSGHIRHPWPLTFDLLYLWGEDTFIQAMQKVQILTHSTREIVESVGVVLSMISHCGHRPWILPLDPGPGSLFWIVVLDPCSGSWSWILVRDPCCGSWSWILDPCSGSLFWILILDPDPGSLPWILVLDPCSGSLFWILGPGPGSLPWILVLDPGPGSLFWILVLDPRSWILVLDPCSGRPAVWLLMWWTMHHIYTKPTIHPQFTRRSVLQKRDICLTIKKVMLFLHLQLATSLKFSIRWFGEWNRRSHSKRRRIVRIVVF